MKKTIVILGLLIYTSNQNNSKTVICKSFNAGTPAGVKGKAKLFDGYFNEKKLLLQQYPTPEILWLKQRLQHRNMPVLLQRLYETNHPEV